MQIRAAIGLLAPPCADHFTNTLNNQAGKLTKTAKRIKPKSHMRLVYRFQNSFDSHKLPVILATSAVAVGEDVMLAPCYHAHLAAVQFAFRLGARRADKR